MITAGPVGTGARGPEVEEPVLQVKSVLFEFEVDEVAEPKALLPNNLKGLVIRNGSYLKASRAIEASEAFIRQKIRGRIRQPDEK